MILHNREAFGMVLLEIMSGKLSGNEWKDSMNRTLRNFVDTNIIELSEPPEEYIAPVDGKNRRFRIDIEAEENGVLQIVNCTADWATIMFDIGRDCTIHDETPWPKDGPWKDNFALTFEISN